MLRSQIVCRKADVDVATALEVLTAGVEQLVRSEAANQPWGVSADHAAQLLQMDIVLNAQGLMSWLEARKKI